MQKQVLFIQGAGEGVYEEDAELVKSLRRALGRDYEVIYPAMPNEADAPYDQWKLRIEKQLAELQDSVILVAHSVGASTLLKCLGQIEVKNPIAGIFLLATPFWGGDGWHYDGYEELELPKDIAATLPYGTPVFIYHCRDDDIVPYEHLALHTQLLPRTTVRRLDKGGHQFNNDLSLVAQDIRSLKL